MQRTTATNTQISEELVEAANRADDAGKTPQGALGDPQKYAASLDYPDKRFKLGEALAGGAVLVGCFLLSDGLQAIRENAPYQLTVGAIASWLLVFGGVLLCLYLAARTSGALVLSVALPLLLVWAFITQTPTPLIAQASPSIPIIVGALILAAAFGYVGSYLYRQNKHPILDPDTERDVRFDDEDPSFVQLWGPLVYMTVAVVMILVLLLI